MLIDHDFDWDPDLEELRRPGLDPVPQNGPGLDPASRRPGGQIRPSEQVVIIERRRGFSRLTLILALVALALSAASTQSCHRASFAGASSFVRSTSQGGASVRCPGSGSRP
jgi:hypothetical protein